CRVSRRDGKRGRATLESRDTLLEHRLGRVHDARVDVAEGLKVEQRRGVVHVLEHVGGRLVDRGRARPGRRIRMRARVDRQGIEARLAVGGHRVFSRLGVGGARLYRLALYAREPVWSIAVVDGDNLEARWGAGGFVAEIVEPDIAAAIADHHPLIVVKVVVRILLEHIGLELGPDYARIMLEDQSLL